MINPISKFILSKLSGHLAWIQFVLLVGGAVWLFWQGYGLCKAGQSKVVSERQAAQIEGEIAISKEVEQLKREIASDEGTDLDIIYNTIKRLH